MSETAIVWLRRDLRLDDNLAIHAAVSSGAKLAVLFVLDDAILESKRLSPARVKFLCDALSQLNIDLALYNSAVIIRRGLPERIVSEVATELGATCVFANQDYTPYARKRDTRVAAALGRVPLNLSHDRVLLAPETIATNSGGVYTVYTPFKNKWRDLPKPFPEPVITDLHGSFADVSQLESLPPPTPESLGLSSSVPVPAAGAHVAQARLFRFTSGPIYSYKDNRNLLADPFDDPHCGTSSLSPYVRWGLISPRQIRRAATEAYLSAPDANSRESVVAWMDEIVWHEFYTYILWHFPKVRSQNFNREFDGLEWRHAPDELAAWKEGKTGFPVIDAAMRQLAATGWMHNRARMIVASFLTKDLLIDWREGESFFMSLLLDGDTAANNGGWQWAAGTGTDAQPFFRIFNPVLQSERFDPGGRFIRRWVPELRDLESKYIHAPWLSPVPPIAYPRPLVDHTLARERALKAFEATKY